MKYQHKTNQTIIDLSEYEEVKETERNWKPAYGKTYYFVDDWGRAVSKLWEDSLYSQWRYNTLNCFRTEQEAKSYRDYLIAVGKVTRRIWELQGDWDYGAGNESIGIYIIDWHINGFSIEEFEVGSITKLPYLRSRNLANQIISELTPELEIIRNYRQ